MKPATSLLFWLLILLGFILHSQSYAQQALDQTDQTGAMLDEFVDLRFEASTDATGSLIKKLQANGVDSAEALERLIRARRIDYPDSEELIGKYSQHDVECYHVDYSSRFLMYVPKDYKKGEEYALVVVGHGGNSSMSEGRAFQVANQYIRLYAPQVTKNMKAIVVAPASERGWGNIGYSLVFSTIAKVKRMFPIDPDRVYLTGQSMGGHLTYRMALTYPDYFGAVSPHSGGYDFVEKQSIGNLLNVPGMSVFGAREPYGINEDNKTNARWSEQHAMNWTFVEKNGGHTIYQDELPKMAKFFDANPRDPYRETLYFRHGGAMKFTKPWDIKGWPEHTVYSDTRPLEWNRKYWLQVQPREEAKEPLEVFAHNQGENVIAVTSSQVRLLTIYLHPKMVDFSKPVTIEVNGKKLFQDRVEPNWELMLNDVRKFDDRGKIYWASVTLSVDSDREVEIPVVENRPNASREER